MLRHGSVVRPTMCLASMDIKTAFDKARPRHVAQIMEDHNTHGWIISALLREMCGLESQAMFECVESNFSFARCLRQGRQNMATQLLADVEEKWARKRMGILLDLEGQGAHQICSFMSADNFWIMFHSKSNLEQMLRNLKEEAEQWDLAPKPAVDGYL